MNKDSLIVKVLKLEDLQLNILEKLDRYQETNKAWYVEDNNYKIKDIHFVDHWDKDRKNNIVKYLRDCITRGGIVVGAYDNTNLIAFANVESDFIGSKKEYLELPFIHVSREYRGARIGRKVFQLLCKLAKEKGAKKLYIGAHPSIETQQFYKSVGCTYAAEIIKEVYDREPLDIQMEYVL